MGKNPNIKTRALQAVRVEEVETLYQQRQTLLNSLSRLEQQRTTAGLQVPPALVAAIANEEAALKQQGRTCARHVGSC